MDKNKVVAVVLTVVVVAVVIVSLYAFVNQMHSNSSEQEENFVQGWVTDAYSTDKQINVSNCNCTKTVWNVSFSPNFQDTENSTSHLMFFVNCSPPPEDVQLKMYYNDYNNYKKIYKIESL